MNLSSNKLLLISAIAWIATLTGCASTTNGPGDTAADTVSYARISLSPENWRPDYEKYLALEARKPQYNPMAIGSNGAITTTYHSASSRAGLEALKNGGTSVDAALTTAMLQIASGAGASISYFGILTMVHYDAASDEIVTLNASWNTVQNEDDPMSIPGTIDGANLFEG